MVDRDLLLVASRLLLGKKKFPLPCGERIKVRGTERQAKYMICCKQQKLF